MKISISALIILSSFFARLSLGSDPLLLSPEQIGETFQSKKLNFKLMRYSYEFETPWSMAFLPNGKVLVTELSGKLFIIENENKIEVTGLPTIDSSGQGGLLDVVLHPNFSKNRKIYLSYAAPSVDGQGSSTAIFQAELIESENGSAEMVKGKTIWRVPQASMSGLQFGSRIVFDKNNDLYLTSGDRRNSPAARNLSDGRGKIIRVHDDGSIPSDNPFVGVQDALPEIWTIGHRNSQGLVLNPVDGSLWETEHGPRGGDELNLILKGADYGWDYVTYGRDYSGVLINGGLRTSPGITDPVVYWETPENPLVDVESPHSIAPSGLAIAYKSNYVGWEGNIFSGALAGEQLRRVELKDNKLVSQEVLLEGEIGRIRDVRMGPDGYLYLLNNDYPTSAIFRLEPVNSK